MPFEFPYRTKGAYKARCWNMFSYSFSPINPPTTLRSAIFWHSNFGQDGQTERNKKPKSEKKPFNCSIWSWHWNEYRNEFGQQKPKKRESVKVGQSSNWWRKLNESWQKSTEK